MKAHTMEECEEKEEERENRKEKDRTEIERKGSN